MMGRVGEVVELDSAARKRRDQNSIKSIASILEMDPKYLNSNDSEGVKLSFTKLDDAYLCACKAIKYPLKKQIYIQNDLSPKSALDLLKEHSGNELISFKHLSVRVLEDLSSQLELLHTLFPKLIHLTGFNLRVENTEVTLPSVVYQGISNMKELQNLGIDACLSEFLIPSNSEKGISLSPILKLLKTNLKLKSLPSTIN